MSRHKTGPAWRRYLRFWGSNLTSDVNDELAFHLEMRIKEYISRGMSPGDARRLAEQRFGDVDRARTSCITIQSDHARTETRIQLGAAIQQDLRFAARVLRRQALPSAVAAICIALGIGATTAMFSVANTMLLRPLPYPNGERLVTIISARKGNRTAGNTVSSMPDFVDWRARQHSFAQLAAAQYQSLTVASGVPIRANGAFATTNLFPTLGVSAEVGRLFRDDDAEPGAPAAAIISHGFAERNFGGAAGIVGQRIRIAGARRTIVGVIPDRWAYPASIDVWLPIRVDPLRESRGNRHFLVVGELRPGVTVEAADRDMHSIGEALARENVEGDGDIMPYVDPLRESFVGSARPTLIALAAATVLILLVACANVAALQLARSSTRAREIAVRGAIGAGRGRIIAQLLTESVLLGLVGGAAGVGIAFASRSMLARAVAANAPIWMTFDIDVRVMGFAVVISVLSAIAFGLAPAIRLTRRDAIVSLHGGSATADRSGARLQRLFVVVELALSVVLVIGAVLAIESVVRLRNVPLGFDPSGLMTFRISMQGQRYDDGAERARVVDALTQRLGALPEVETAAATTYMPVIACCSQFGTTIEGQAGPSNERLMVTGSIVSPGFFSAMRIPMLSGRDFLPSDNASGLRVVIINKTFAQRYWPEGNAPGHRIDTGNGMATIVGIVGDIKQGRLVDTPEPQFYRPYAQDPWTTMAIVVRLRGSDTTHMAGALRQATRDVDPVALPIARVLTMQRVLDDATASSRVLGQLLALFAATALALAAIGIYAIMSFFVVRRTRELGVRIALGATPAAVLSLVLRQSGTIAAMGGVLGLVAGAMAARALAHTLYGVSAAEPVIYVTAALTLALAAFAASIAPARRASTVDPLVALRTE